MALVALVPVVQQLAQVQAQVPVALALLPPVHLAGLLFGLPFWLSLLTAFWPFLQLLLLQPPPQLLMLPALLTLLALCHRQQGLTLG